MFIATVAMATARPVGSGATRKTGIPSWYMLVCIVLGVSNAFFPWADKFAEHIDKASAAMIVRMVQDQLSDEPKGPTVVAAAAVLAGNAHGLNLRQDAALNKKHVPEQFQDGQTHDTSVPKPVNLFGPFDQLQGLKEGMNYLTGTVDKVESFFITYGAIMWKMLLLYVIYYVSGSWRLVVVSWLTINLLGTQLAASMALACFMLVSILLAEGPIATSLIGGLWLIHEAGCLDLSYWGKKGTNLLRRELHMQQREDGFTLEDMRQLLHKPLLAASFLPLLVGCILFSSGMTPAVSATGDSRRDQVIGGYCLVMGTVYLLLACVAEADGSLGHLSPTKLSLAAMTSIFLGTYLVGNWLDSSAFVNGLEPAGNGTVADNSLIPFAPVFRVQSWNLYVGLAFILIGLMTIVHAIVLKKHTGRRHIEAEGVDAPLNRP